MGNKFKFQAYFIISLGIYRTEENIRNLKNLKVGYKN